MSLQGTGHAMSFNSYKQFNSDDVQYIENDVNRTETLLTSSQYVKSVAFDSSSENSDGTPHDSSSYYNSINQLFYKIQDFR